MNTLPLIIFIFLGHSNMDAGCAAVPHGKYGKFPTMFLQEMQIRYPDRHFSAICKHRPSARACDFNHGINNYDTLLSKIKIANDTAIIGGIVINLGFIEGKDSVLAVDFGLELNRIIYEIRATIKDFSVPAIICRYERNNQQLPEISPYRKYSKLVDDAIEQYGQERYSILTPVRHLPKTCHCENHHSTSDGYKILISDAIAQYQLFNYDKRGRNDTR